MRFTFVAMLLVACTNEGDLGDVNPPDAPPGGGGSVIDARNDQPDAGAIPPPDAGPFG